MMPRRKRLRDYTVAEWENFSRSVAFGSGPEREIEDFAHVVQDEIQDILGQFRIEPADRDDLCQGMLIKLLGSEYEPGIYVEVLGKTGYEPRKFQNYLSGWAKNEVRSHFRKKANVVCLLAPDTSLFDRFSDPTSEEKIHSQIERRCLASSVLEKLTSPPVQRLIEKIDTAILRNASLLIQKGTPAPKLSESLSVVVKDFAAHEKLLPAVLLLLETIGKRAEDFAANESAAEMRDASTLLGELSAEAEEVIFGGPVEKLERLVDLLLAAGKKERSEERATEEEQARRAVQLRALGAAFAVEPQQQSQLITLLRATQVPPEKIEQLLWLLAKCRETERLRLRKSISRLGEEFENLFVVISG